MAPPPPQPPWRRDPAAAAARLRTASAWRRGSRLTLALAPAAAITGALAPAAAGLTFAAALALVVAIEAVARETLRACVLQPDLRGVPAVARERARLAGPAHRRRLAGSVRRTALYVPRSAQERRLSPYAPERLAAARADLLDLAAAVDAAAHADPAVLVEIEALLCDFPRSPLLNTDIPLPELSATLRRARHRLTVDASASAFAGGRPRPSRRPAAAQSPPTSSPR
jgi:hypothetical protein